MPRAPLHRDWTEDEEAVLRSLRAKGFSWARVALRLKRTVSACRSRSAIIASRERASAAENAKAG